MIAMKTIGVFVILFFNLLGIYAQQDNRYKDENGGEILISIWGDFIVFSGETV